ncbi:hypothetical protein I302_103149 [Kwoniella bestiolae CBS 10118]|uniref:Uncharacterized protein n=1 Tax=Kwoniella bestiolae CBS 10118 TaxID=1296100 RepID=A0A1B9G7M3_9TREE|nr:hypothetical protein I302_01847 [Kwoniella bestiolae CBS 10118]OCF27012.1 hypothetical protein I302_01847 [Kwoniella bestiolae CBS 10118]
MDKNAPSGRSLAQRKEEAVTKIFVMKSARRKCDESQASGSAEANRTPYRQALLGEPDALSELKDILLLEAKRKRLDNDYQDLSSGARPQRRDYDETCARMYKDHELYLLRLDRMASQLGVSGGKSKEPAGSDRSLCPSVRPSRSSAAWSNASCNTVSTNTSSLSRSNAVKVESRNGRPQISEQIAQGRFSIPPWPTNNTLSRPPSLPSLDTKTLFKGKPLVMDYPPNLQTACSSNTAINDSNSSDDQPVLSSSTANSANDPPTASSPTTPFVTGPTTQLLLTAAPTDEEEFEEIDYFPRQPTLYSTSATPWNSQGFIYTPLSESASEAGSSRAKAPASNVGDTSTKTWEDIDLSSVSHWFDEDQMDRSTRPSISNSLKSAFDSASRFARDTKNEFVRYADSHWQGFLSKAGSGM